MSLLRIPEPFPADGMCRYYVYEMVGGCADGDRLITLTPVDDHRAIAKTRAGLVGTEAASMPRDISYYRTIRQAGEIAVSASMVKRWNRHEQLFRASLVAMAARLDGIGELRA